MTSSCAYMQHSMTETLLALSCHPRRRRGAAYAADGYARTKRTVASLVTTFGVGELSALNGVAGAFSEQLPVVHVVGTPSTTAQGSHALLHHTLGDGRFEAFERMSANISAATARLAELQPQESTREIDRVLTICVRQARPVYIALPTDRVHTLVDASALATPLDVASPPNDAEVEADVLKEIVSRVRAAKDPIILVDACAIRHHVVSETHDLVDKSGLPVFSSPMGKTAVDEDHQQYGGIYVGDISDPALKERVHNADCVLSVGALLSDFNTGNFSYRTPRAATIELHSTHTQIGYAQYPGIAMKSLLPKVADALAVDQKKRLEATLKTTPRMTNRLPTPEEEGDVAKANPDIISQAWLWPRLGAFFRPKDQIVVETGTSSFGMLQARLPPQSHFVSQVLWGSIGWSVGAALGVAGAAREEKLGRTCLFVGDGSLQLSAQEISTMIKRGLTPILFVLSNDGYCIERTIHGPDRSYNDIAPWNHSLLLDAFSAAPNTVRNVYEGKATGGQLPPSHAKDPTPSKRAYHAVRTKGELDALLKDEEFNRAERIQLVEIFMDRDDAPLALRRQAEATSQANKYE